MTITFSVTVFAWIFFRAENMRHAWDYLKSMFSGLLNIPNYTTTAIFIKTEIGIILPLLIAVFMIIEWLDKCACTNLQTGPVTNLLLDGFQHAL